MTLREEQARLLAAGVPLGIAGNVLLALLTVSVLGEWPASGIWLALMALVLAARALLTWRGAAWAPARRLRALRWGAIATGLLWGVVSLLLFPPDLTRQVFLAFVLAGVSAAAVAALAVDRPAAGGFLLAALLPLVLRLLAAGGEIQEVMALMVAAFVVFMYATLGRIHLMLAENIRLKGDAEASAVRAAHNQRLTDAITRVQARFIASADRHQTFDTLLQALLDLTDSEYGFIGEVRRDADGTPWLKTFALTNIAWDDATRAFYEAHAPAGLEFRNLNTLFGAALRTGAPVISNDPAHDPRRGGLPPGHPPLTAFLGLPVYHGERFVALVGLANRPGGYSQALVEWLAPLTVTIGQLVVATQQAAALELQRSRLNALFELSPVGIALNDMATGRFLEANDALIRPTGYSRDAFFALSYWDLTPPEYAAQEAAQLEQLRTSGRYGPYEKEYRRKDGSRYPVRLSGVRIVDADGRELIWSIVEDVSEWRAIQTRLLEQARETRAIVDSILEAVITIDEAGTVLSFNPAAEKMFGWPAPEIIGRNVSLLMPSPHREAHDGYIRRYLEHGEPRIIGIGREVQGQRRDGSLFPMELSVVEIRRGAQRIFVGTARDLTEAKRVERMKNEFLATVSHELRTPLTALLGSLGLLAAGVAGSLPDTAREMLELARRNGERLTKLINDLLTMESIAAGRLRLHLRRQPLGPLLVQGVDAMRGYAQSREVGLTLEGSAEDVLVEVDADRLGQVLANLLANAIKFSPQGGRVTVRAVTEGRTVRVSVCDQGPGVPEAFRPRLFQRFAQADASDSRRLGGTGLGLAISKELVEHMGGRIGHEPATGGGACFWFELPLAAALPVEGQEKADGQT